MMYIRCDSRSTSSTYHEIGSALSLLGKTCYSFIDKIYTNDLVHTHHLILNIKWPPLSPTCSPWHSGDINSHIVRRDSQKKTRLNNEPGLLADISFITLTRTLNLSIVLSSGLSFSFIAPSSRWGLRDLLPNLVFFFFFV